MREADHRCLVTTGSLTHFQEDVNRWTGQVGAQFGIDQQDYQLVLLQGKYTHAGGFGMKEIRKETGIVSLSELHLAESVHLQLDSGRLDEWLAAEERNAAAFDAVADPLLRKLNWGERMKRSDRPWLRRLLSHRGRGR
ncbi:hypothetical protein [Cohnella nanjingensis]|uniref:Uncharacterized protein n=1 Tax=Cohnella nanjingensis TaxID=1387779 RepID=A0A7X0RS20_9BACL|nr:hypothetical protein [Cohnella nanjingensis]MBB6672642.1 hypothetical protein [Cohnella nanjingensis]